MLLLVPCGANEVIVAPVTQVAPSSMLKVKSTSINDNVKPAEGEMKRRPRRRPSNGGKGYGGAAKG